MGKWNQSWLQDAEARTELAARQILLHKMVQGWSRRGHSLLECGCGAGFFLKNLWQAGFDVTGVEQDEALLRLAREAMHGTAIIEYAHPEHLPFDDDSFDYAIYIHGLEQEQNLGQVLEELGRVAAKGILLGFNNSFSLRSLLRSFGKVAPDNISLPGQLGQINPSKVYDELKNSSKSGTLHWGSCLLGPGLMRSDRSKLERALGPVDYASLPLPLGGYAMLRLDIAPALAGNQLILNFELPRQETSLAGSMGRSFPQSGQGQD